MSEIEEPKPVSETTSSTTDTAPPERRPRRRGGGITVPLILIFIGVILLLNTTNVIPWNVWGRLWMLWPALLILIGLDVLLRHAPFLLRLVLALVALGVLIAAGVYLVYTAGPVGELVTLDRDYSLAEASRGEVVLSLGVGELVVGAAEGSNDLAQVRLRGWVENREPDFRQSGDLARLEIEQWAGDFSWWFNWWPGDIRWQVDLSTRVPLRLDVDTGVGQSRLDLRNLRVEDLQLNSGVGEVEVTLPAEVERGTVYINAGVGAVRVNIPQGVAAEISVNTGLGRVSVDTRRFQEVGEDLYRSGDYGEARYRLRIEINGGIGSIEIR